MKNKLKTLTLTLLSAIMLVGCVTIRSPEEKHLEAIRAEVAELTIERDKLKQEIASLNNYDGHTRYVVVIKIRQSHPIAIDPIAMIKDGMNAIELPIYVDKGFYDGIEVGEVLDDSFRVGSLWIDGSIGSWDIKVVDKKVVN